MGTKVYNTTENDDLRIFAGNRYVPLGAGESYDAADDEEAARLVSAHPGVLSLLPVGGGIGAALDRSVAAAQALTEGEEGIAREAIVGDDATVPGSGNYVSAAQANEERTQGEQTGDDADTEAVASAPLDGEGDAATGNPAAPSSREAGQAAAEAGDEAVAEAEERQARKTTPRRGGNR